MSAACAVAFMAAPASAAPVSQAVAPAVAAGPPNKPCGTLPDYSSNTSTTAGKPAHVRTGTTSECSIIGLIHIGDRLNLACYTVDAIDRHWSYVDDYDSGASGWVLDQSLSRPAGVRCFQ